MTCNEVGGFDELTSCKMMAAVGMLPSSVFFKGSFPSPPYATSSNVRRSFCTEKNDGHRTKRVSGRSPASGVGGRIQR